MRSFTIAIVFMLGMFGAFRAYGETKGAALVGVFKSLSNAQIWNVVYIPEHPTSYVVILYEAHGPTESIKAFSVANKRAHTVWSLNSVPLFMGVIDPNDLHVVSTSAGPAVVLHGCAPHDCGGQGVAGAFVYLLDSHQYYTAYAVWSASTHKTKFRYSRHGAPTEPPFIKQILNKMLKKEGYSPQ